MSYDVHGDIMYAKDIDGRIDGLEGIPANFARSLDWDEEDELKALKRFRQQVRKAYGTVKWLHGMSFISDSYTDQYAQDQAEDLYSGAETEYWDRDAWADHYYEGYQVFKLEDEKYLANGER